MRLKSRWGVVLLILPLWPVESFGIDPHVALEQNLIQTWGVDQGLPQGIVSSVVQTSDGYIWAGTQEGFVRFDGVNFVVYDKAATEAIRSNITRALLPARDGSLYAATNGGGLIHVEGQQIHSYRMTDGLPSNSVTALYQSSDSTIWIGTQKGLARRQNDRRVVLVASGEQLPHPAITALTEDWSGQLWIGTRQGIATLKDGHLFRHDMDGFPTEQILSLCATRDGSVWIGTQGGGLLRYRSGKFRIYTESDGLPSKSPSAIYEDRHGTIWIGTLDRGVGRFRNNQFDFDFPAAGIGNKAVSSFLEDREGNLWIGSAQGLTRIAEPQVLTFTTAQGLSADNIRTVQADSAGTLWVGTGRGLQTLDGSRSISKESGLSSDLVLSTWSSRDGSLWIGTFDGGLNRVFQGKTTIYDTNNGLRGNLVLSVYEDHSGVVWVGTSRGLQRIVTGIVAPDSPKLSGEAVGVMYEDANGALWAGTQDGGLNRIAGVSATSFTTRNGLSSDLVLSLYEDRTGALWVGTAGGGLNRYKSGRWKTITTKEGLFDDSVFAILEDNNGFLWMSCNKGIFRVPRQQLDAVAEGLQQKVRSVAYGRADGMKSRECNGGTQPAAWKTADGKLWFATNQGVAMIDTNTVRMATAPPLIIEEVIADDHRRSPADSQPLAPGTKTLEFHYAGMNFAAPGKVHYQYKLDGFDREWIDACAHIFGFSSRAELIAHGMSDLYRSDTDRQTMFTRLRDHGSLSNFETSLRRIDGTDVWVLMNITLVTDGQAEPIIEANLVDINDRKQAEEQIRYEAHHDVLTELPNRALFKDRLAIALQYARRHGNQVAVLCLDLDHFKVINDTLGRSIGNCLLRTVATRLSSCVRQEDSVARVGLDEFALLIMKPRNAADVTSVARKILQTVARPITVDGHELDITTSIGISFYPTDGEDLEALLKNATHALYNAKEAGRNRYELCSPFLTRQAADRLSLENALHQALERQEFVLHYQPQLDLRTQKLIGAETLIRWDRPGKGILRPAEFIDVAEESQLIVPIGDWVLETACRQARVWHSTESALKIAVNVSARQFQQPNVVSVIREALDRSGLDPHFHEVEITETTAMQNPTLTADILLDLKKMGISIAIDDFGVGHSSLNYLKRFPIDVVKIDSSFVKDIPRGGIDAAIVCAVIAMAKALNIRVLAEGVETDEQLNFLREHGCYEFQGYLLSRPLPVDAFTEMIHTASAGAYTRRYALGMQALPTEH